MEEQARALAALLVQRLKAISPTSRLLVGLAGIPASGKSSLAKLIIRYTNALLPTSGNGDAEAILVGLDGWHLTREQLDAFPDAQLAHDRRGAHWTFDGPAYVSFVRLLRETPPPDVIEAPSFDHALKDPVAGAVRIQPRHRIVLIEGLYVFLAIEPWRKGGEMLDERWLVRVDVEEAQRRLVKRHVVSGVAKDMEEAVWRAEENDMPNGRFMLDNILEPTRYIESVEDPAFVLP